MHFLIFSQLIVVMHELLGITQFVSYPIQLFSLSKMFLSDLYCSCMSGMNINALGVIVSSGSDCHRLTMKMNIFQRSCLGII